MHAGFFIGISVLKKLFQYLGFGNSRAQGDKPPSNSLSPKPNAQIGKIILAIVLVGGFISIIFITMPGSENENPVISPSAGPSIAINTRQFSSVTDIPVTNTPVPSKTPYSTKAYTPSPTYFVSVNGNRVNLRNGPGLTYEIVGTTKRGDVFPVYAKDDTGNWLKVNWEYEIYISAGLVKDLKGDTDIRIYVVSATLTTTPSATTSWFEQWTRGNNKPIPTATH